MDVFRQAGNVLLQTGRERSFPIRAPLGLIRPAHRLAAVPPRPQPNEEPPAAPVEMPPDAPEVPAPAMPEFPGESPDEAPDSTPFEMPQEEGRLGARR